MIQINLRPARPLPNKALQDLLLPSVTYLLNETYLRACEADDDDLIKWGRAWACLLFLRQELLWPGYSPGDHFAQNLMSGDLDTLINFFETQSSSGT